MTRLAILIPTYCRADKLKKLLANIKKTTTVTHTIYVIAEQSDTDTTEVAHRAGATVLINPKPNTYVGAINYGFKTSTEPYVFCAADDVRFTKGWSEEVLEKLEQGYGFVGVKDDWPITKTGKHASHFAVSRKYIDDEGGVLDCKGVIYHPGYHHYQCDIETEQTAMGRGQFVMADATVHHDHWVNGVRDKDGTDTKENPKFQHDLDEYKARRKTLNFEIYSYEELSQGRVAMIMPELKTGRPKLSIIVASYNATPYLVKTIESIKENTYYPYELIVVDDSSTDPTTVQYIKKLAIQDRIVKKLYTKKQLFTDGVWNMGVEASGGDYIAILNNDITLSKHWDLYLITALQKKNAWMSNPYQTDPGCYDQYGKHERGGDIDIRGTCYMLKREAVDALFPIPYQLVHWFGDYYLAEAVKNAGKKSVWVSEAIVHHFVSISTDLAEAEHKQLWWVIRGDCYAFEKMTGIDTSHWVQIIESRLGIGDHN